MTAEREETDVAARDAAAEWVRPPRLATGEERTASRLELFYDLAYVLVVAELASAFLKDLSWSGAAVFAGLFTAMWFSWVSTTLYANRFDTDDVVFRLAQLVGTAAIAGCAAAATGADGATAVPFAACFLLGRVVLLALYVRAWRHVPESRGNITVYLGSTGIAAALWAVSLAVPAPTRYVLWAVAVVIDAAGPVVATWRGDTAPLHMDHLPERFGLFVILVLGEVVAGIVTGVHDAAWAGLAVVVAAVGFVVGGALWWTYFDVASASGNEELQDDEDEEEEDEADVRHDLYVYGHLPLSLGIAAAGVGIEELVMHPYAALPAPAGWTAIGGITLTLIGAGIVLVGAHKRLSALWPWPVAAIAPLLVLTVLDVPVLVLVGLLALITVAVAVSGARQRARRGVALA
ncbi:low temperature requirement protein A [Pseudonocardia xinjiangensis]|uniref:Low temperature requirement protein A n=1 Tax=Pseudonocardia xinjiangensis TaxID=75289 RepID=A0ABX1RJ45_9PSEU|nr:low temperature requirement protein A [Pseudonocardia xinjiangensis]NMH80415.1 low temperature requirement protein A [Pseudonocardia xinjiangensis]